MRGDVSFVFDNIRRFEFQQCIVVVVVRGLGDYIVGLFLVSFVSSVFYNSIY